MVVITAVNDPNEFKVFVAEPESRSPRNLPPESGLKRLLILKGARRALAPVPRLKAY